MATAQQLEEQLVISLKQSDDENKALVAFRQRARLAERNDRFVEMGVIYGAMATFLPQDLDLPLRTAQAYQKAGLTDDMARYYLVTIERYINKSDPTQAAAILKQFLSLDNHNAEIPASILALCDKHGVTHPSIPASIPILSDEEKASGRLRQLVPFAAMDERIFSRVIKLMRRHKHPMGQMLINQGTKAEGMYFIIRGSVDIFIQDGDQRKSLGHLSKQGIYGQFAALTGGTHFVNVVAMSDVELMELPVSNLNTLSSLAPEFLKGLYHDCQQQSLLPQLSPSPALLGLEHQIRKRIHKRIPQLKVSTSGWLRKVG